ncbi:tRNAHis guanylyltransferase [Peniophora sp. CONT]|nr:tRNAHis guanylyltransferase [Peniophora sp. CONT]
MAGSRFAYVKSFELPDPLLPGTFIVLRLDGHAFHRFSDVHQFVKPNDVRALELMDRAARAVMDEYKDIVLAFGESDEFSFLLRRSAQLYNRREAKILTTLCSYFTSAYIFHWPNFFPDTPLVYPPCFDGRIVLYPSDREVRDYFAWRQADTHINNLYNTAFWALVQQGGKSTTEAHETLKGTVSNQKHDILFSRFNVNYNELDARYRKGSILVREPIPEAKVADGSGSGNEAFANSDRATTQDSSDTPIESAVRKKATHGRKKIKTRVELVHCDIIGDGFWTARPQLLAE